MAPATESQKRRYQRIKHEAWYREYAQRLSQRHYYANQEKHRQRYILKKEIARLSHILLDQ